MSDAAECLKPMMRNTYEVPAPEPAMTAEKLKMSAATISATHLRLADSECEHNVAFEDIAMKYYLLMIPSIMISAFLAVISIVLPDGNAEDEKMVRQISAVLNAFNAVLLGLSGLLKYQSKMEAHSNAASQCVALKKECDQLVTTFKMLSEGVQTEDTPKQFTELMRNLPAKLTNINTRHGEVEQMCPINDRYAFKARRRMDKLRAYELKLIPNAIKHKEEMRNMYYEDGCYAKVLPKMAIDLLGVADVPLPQGVAASNRRISPEPPADQGIAICGSSDLHAAAPSMLVGSSDVLDVEQPPPNASRLPHVARPQDTDKEQPRPNPDEAQEACPKLSNRFRRATSTSGL